MNFLTKREEYKTVYNKKQAIQQLKNDERIKKIKTLKEGLIVYTKPIYPKSKQKKFNKIYDYPIGTYKITLGKCPYHTTSISVERLEGCTPTEKWQHIHINEAWMSDVCWGNISERIMIMKKYKDYYWIIKTCLDLLEDGEQDEGLCIKDIYHIFIGLQVTYEKQHKNRADIIKKLKDRHKKYVKEKYNKNYRVMEAE
jgi:hypothetical protein